MGERSWYAFSIHDRFRSARNKVKIRQDGAGKCPAVLTTEWQRREWTAN